MIKFGKQEFIFNPFTERKIEKFPWTRLNEQNFNYEYVLVQIAHLGQGFSLFFLDILFFPINRKRTKTLNFIKLMFSLESSGVKFELKTTAD